MQHSSPVKGHQLVAQVLKLIGGAALGTVHKLVHVLNAKPLPFQHTAQVVGLLALVLQLLLHHVERGLHHLAVVAALGELLPGLLELPLQQVSLLQQLVTIK